MCKLRILRVIQTLKNFHSYIHRPILMNIMILKPQRNGASSHVLRSLIEAMKFTS